jgi:hypothetical protein
MPTVMDHLIGARPVRLTNNKTSTKRESRAVSMTPGRNASRKWDFHPHHKTAPTHPRDGLNRMFSNNGEFTKSAA